MAWCHQAPSHYLNQCWPRFLLPYGITRPQWVYPYISYDTRPPVSYLQAIDCPLSNCCVVLVLWVFCIVICYDIEVLTKWLTSWDDICQCILLKENFHIFIQISHLGISIKSVVPIYFQTAVADNISKCIFFWKKIIFWMKFHWNLFLRVQLTTITHGLW